MTKGKMVAQGAHASLAVFFDAMRFQRKVGGGGSDIDWDRVTPDNLTSQDTIPIKTEEEWTLHVWECLMTPDMNEWKMGAFAKIALAADEPTMESALREARKVGVPCSEIHDNGVTQVEPESFTASAIGPFDVTNPKYANLVRELASLKLL
jgi:peptidyl-tRNA hydrolase